MPGLKSPCHLPCTCRLGASEGLGPVCIHFAQGEKGTCPDQLRCAGDKSTAVPVTALLSTR